MVIDFHTHIFPDKIAERAITKLETNANIKAFLNGTKARLYESMLEEGVDISVLLPVVTDPKQTESINRFALEITEEYADEKTGRFISFGGVHPKSPTLKEDLKWIKEHGLLGIKLHPDYQDTYFNDRDYERAVDYASELGLITVVHAGVDLAFPEDVHCTPQMAAKVIETVRPEKLVLAHTGGYLMWDEVEEWIVGKDVYMDISYSLHRISREQFVRIVRNHGVERMLFGTDSPWGGQSQVQELLEKMPLTPEEKESILWKNGAKLLRL